MNMLVNLYKILGSIAENSFFLNSLEKVKKSLPTGYSELLHYNNYTITININNKRYEIDMVSECSRRDSIVDWDEENGVYKMQQALVGSIVSLIQTIFQEAQASVSSSKNFIQANNSSVLIPYIHEAGFFPAVLQNNAIGFMGTSHEAYRLLSIFRNSDCSSNSTFLIANLPNSLGNGFNHVSLNDKPVQNFNVLKSNSLFTPHGFEFDVRFLLAMPIVIALIYFGLKRKKNTVHDERRVNVMVENRNDVDSMVRHSQQPSSSVHAEETNLSFSIKPNQEEGYDSYSSQAHSQLDENTWSSFYIWLTSPTTPEFLAMLALVAGLALITAAIATAAITAGVGVPAACLMAAGGIAAIMGGIGLYRNRGGNGGDAGSPRDYSESLVNSSLSNSSAQLI